MIPSSFSTPTSPTDTSLLVGEKTLVLHPSLTEGDCHYTRLTGPSGVKIMKEDSETKSQSSNFNDPSIEGLSSSRHSSSCDVVLGEMWVEEVHVLLR